MSQRDFCPSSVRMITMLHDEAISSKIKLEKWKWINKVIWSIKCATEVFLTILDDDGQ